MGGSGSSLMAASRKTKSILSPFDVEDGGMAGWKKWRTGDPRVMVLRRGRLRENLSSVTSCLQTSSLKVVSRPNIRFS